MKTFSEIEDMVGKTYGSGKDVRVVTRIAGLERSGSCGTVYWKRPGGKERAVGKYLPHFLQWVEEQARKSQRTEIAVVEDIENFTSNFPSTKEIEGYIERVGNDVTIRFTIK